MYYTYEYDSERGNYITNSLFRNRQFHHKLFLSREKRYDTEMKATSIYFNCCSRMGVKYSATLMVSTAQFKSAIPSAG